MAEVGVLTPSSATEKTLKKRVAPILTPVQDEVLTPISGESKRATYLDQANKMLVQMGLLTEGAKLKMVGKFAKNNSKLKIMGRDGEQHEFSYTSLEGRFRKLEAQAIKDRKAKRDKLAYVAAAHHGKRLSELHVRENPAKEGVIGKELTLEIWSRNRGKTSIKSVDIDTYVASLEEKKVSVTQAIANLTKVYGSKRVAIEKYISQTALGQAAEQAFQSRYEKLAQNEQKFSFLESLPNAEKRKVGRRIQLGLASIKKLVDKPLSYVEAVSKAAIGLVLYDWSPLRHLDNVTGNKLGKAWTDVPLSTWVLPKLGVKEAGVVSMRELAGRLEEKLLIDPITGKGIRTGGISGAQIREASVNGALWALRMNMLPEMLAKLPMIKALSLSPGEIYSIMRSTNMLKGGVGSIKKFVEMWNEKKTWGEKAKVAGWVLGSGVSFYLAEKLSPVIGGEGGINPVLMTDIALMRLVGLTEKYRSSTGVGTTETAETFEMVEHGITAAFAFDSATSVGDRLWTYAEARTLNPMSKVASETELVRVATEHPEWLRGETGGPFGKWIRFEHELLSKMKGIPEKENQWMTFGFENQDGTKSVYHVDPGKGADEVVIVRQDSNGDIAQFQNGKWVEFETGEVTKDVDSEPDLPDIEVEKVAEEAAQEAVHDYVYFDPDFGRMALRLDLAKGDTWESKVARLFAGYTERGIDDPVNKDAPTGKEVQVMEEGSAKLGELSGTDHVYETQVYDQLISRLLRDAKDNGLVYDQLEIERRMVAFLKTDATNDLDTVEGEISYEKLYQYLFLGSQVSQDVSSIDTLLYKPYFLDGTEGTSRGLEVAITIPDGGSFLGELANQGYGNGDGKIFDAQSRLLPDAKIIKLNTDGSESEISDWAKLSLVQPGDKFVVRTGIGESITKVKGEMPSIVPFGDDGIASWEFPGLSADITVENAGSVEMDWYKDVVRNDKGEIYFGEVGEGDIFSQMMVDRFDDVMDNPWNLLGVFQGMTINGVSVYAEDATGETRYFNSYDDLNSLKVGEKIVIVDPHHVLTEVPDQVKVAPIGDNDWSESEPDMDSGTISTSPVIPVHSTVVGFTNDGRIDPSNLPSEIYRDTDGYVYIGEIFSGMWLSSLVNQKLGVSAWDGLYQAQQQGLVEFFTLADSGEYVPMTDVNRVAIGDKIVIKDANMILGNIKNIEDVIKARQQEYAPIIQPQTEAIDIASVSKKLEAEIAKLGADVEVRLSVMDPDNLNNSISIGENDAFLTNSSARLGVALLVLRAVERGELDLGGKSRFAVLPGEYVPTLEELLRLSIVYSDVYALDALEKELLGDLPEADRELQLTERFVQDLKLSRSPYATATSADLIQILNVIYRTDYLSKDSRDLIDSFLKVDGSNDLISDDLSIFSGISIAEKSIIGSSGAINGADSPTISSMAFVDAADRDLIISISVNSSDPNVARSALRTLSREIVGEMIETGERGYEFDKDRAYFIYTNPSAQIDFLNYIFYPRLGETGSYELNPDIAKYISPKKLGDLNSFERDMVVYPDGSSEIHLSRNDGVVLSVYTDSQGRVSSVLTSVGSKDAFLYEVIGRDEVDAPFIESQFKGESESITITASYESGNGFFISTAEGRRYFVDSMREKGSSYDYYIFSGSPYSDTPVLVSAYDGSERSKGSLPSDVQVAFVGFDRNAISVNPGVTTAWEYLGNQLTTSKSLIDIEWQDGLMTYSQVNSDNLPLHAWFEPLIESSHDDWFLAKDKSIYESEYFVHAVKSTLGVDLPSDSTSVTVDGVSYSTVVYAPQGMSIDKAVIARTYGFEVSDIVVMPTSDQGVYLIGEKLEQGRTAESYSSYSHPADQLLYEYADGTVTDKFVADPANLLRSVYPLTKPLQSYVATDRLVKLPETIKASVQFYGDGYFIKNDSDGDIREVFVDPHTLMVYLQNKDGFFPLVGHTFTYEQMQQLYSENTNKIWERRVVEDTAYKLLNNSTDAGFFEGALRIYDKEGVNGEKSFHLLKDTTGMIQINVDGRFIFTGNHNEQVVFDGTSLIAHDVGESSSLDSYLADFAYVTDATGQPLQHKGYPLFEREGVYYAVSDKGVEIVGSAIERPVDPFIGDAGVLPLLADWHVTKSVTMDEVLNQGTNPETLDATSIVHSLAAAEPSLIEISNGVIDQTTGETYRVYVANGKTWVDAKTGALIYLNEGNSPVIWNQSKWEIIEANSRISIEDFWSSKGCKRLSLVDPTFIEAWNALTNKQVDMLNRELVDRRTGGAVYTDGEWAYVLDGKGLVRIGKSEAMINAGFVGYHDENGVYQTIFPDNLWSYILHSYRYPVSERASIMFNPILNSFIDVWANIGNLWGNYEITDVLPQLNQQDYLSYEALPPSYVSALISQENKRLYRYDEGEAVNFDLSVLLRMVTSLGRSGGSTLTQGLIKNTLMSVDERLERSLSRKVNELLVADQVLEENTVESIVTMYANSVTYGSYNGENVLGIERAATVLFAKDVDELTLAEIGLLVAAPNYPARNNLGLHNNAVGWADSASGVFRHMYENGFITESEMKEGFLDAHEITLPHGDDTEIDFLIDTGILKESDREWAIEQSEKYSALDFEGRKLVEEQTINRETLIKSHGRREVVETIETSYSYADFFQYLSINDSSKFSADELEVANSKYYWWGKVPAGDASYTATKVVGNIEVGESFTLRAYNPDPTTTDLTPRVSKDPVTGDVLINTWSYRYEAMEQDEHGNQRVFNVLNDSITGSPLVQDNDGLLWRVGADGLVRVPGKVYQIEGGGAVQVEATISRPGTVVTSLVSEQDNVQLVTDVLGNYYSITSPNTVKFVGRSMIGSQGEIIVYPVQKQVSFTHSGQPEEFVITALENAFVYHGSTSDFREKLIESIPATPDPNVGYMPGLHDGEFGLVNPVVVEKLLSEKAVESVSLELNSSMNGKNAFIQVLEECVNANKPLVVWLNLDLSSDVVRVENRDVSRFEAISRYELPVSVLSTFKYNSAEYVVYQDPRIAETQVLSLQDFTKLASPSLSSRYKLLVADDYIVPEDAIKEIFDSSKNQNQVAMLMEDGYQFNSQKPGFEEGLMTINPTMQSFVSENGSVWLRENEASGFIALGMDQNGNMPFAVALDSQGKQADPQAAYGTYQPGSVYKLVTSLWALNSGFNPGRMLVSGDYYEWEEGDRTYNWTMDAKTGKLVASSASKGMTIADGIKYSNNPFFINLTMSQGDPSQLSVYANKIGFGDGNGAGIGFPGRDSIVPEAGDPRWQERDFAYTSIGQGPVAVSPIEMLRFVNAISTEGVIVEPTLAREAETREWGTLPNKVQDIRVVAEAMHEVTSSPKGTAYRSFGNVRGYDVYGKTGTAEIGSGEAPHAWFVGWAIDKKTGEKLSFVFLFPNGGEGSAVAAPFARRVLDSYFADVQTNRAKTVITDTEEGRESTSVQVEDESTFVVPPQPVRYPKEVEKGVIGFNLEHQPNDRLISFVSDASTVANAFIPSAPDLSNSQQGKEFVEYLQNELREKGYSDVIDTPGMQSSLRLLRNDYLKIEDDDGNTEPIQCVAWQIFIGNALLPGAPRSMGGSLGDAEDLAAKITQPEVMTGDKSPIGGTVIRFANDVPEIALLKAGDTFLIRYKGQKDTGHVGTILATGRFPNGAPAVLVSDSNRFVDTVGRVVTDGSPRVQWMSQAEFVRQYHREGDRFGGVAASQFAVIRQTEDQQIESMFEADYQPTITSETPIK